MLNVFGYYQDGYNRYDQPARSEVFHIGDDAFSRHAADLSADNLDGDHERCRQKNRPQQAISKLRSGLGISRDARRIVVGGPVTSPGPSSRNKIFARLSGDFLRAALEEFMALS
jgi:hypothetical protein